MIRRPPRSTLFPTRRSSDLKTMRGASDGPVIGSLNACAADEKADRKSTRLNSSHQIISYAVFCLKKKKRPSLIAASELATSQLLRCVPNLGSASSLVLKQHT